MEYSNRILISGYYGFDNSGDDAILKAMIKDFRSKNEDIDIIVLSKNPSKTQDMYLVKAIDRFNFKEVIKTMKEVDLFLSGGGSLLQDVTSTRSLVYYLWTMQIAKICKKPVMVYANGIGPINKKINRFLTKRILNKVDLITLRDRDSKDYVLEMGVTNKNIRVTADPVFTLEASSKEEVADIFTREAIPRDKKIIGISVRNWNNNLKLIREVALASKYILENYDVNILLIPMHYPEDLDISYRIKNEINLKGIYVMEDKYNVEEIMGFINEMELIIAMRLHALIYAATQEVPIVGLAYDPKVEGILSSLGIDNFCSVDNLDHRDLIDNIDEVWKNRQEIREDLKLQDDELKKKALANVDMALALLENR